MHMYLKRFILSSIFALLQVLRHCDQLINIFACLCICLYISADIFQESYVQISGNFLYMLPLLPWLDPLPTQWNTLCISGLMDDVLFR